MDIYENKKALEDISKLYLDQVANVKQREVDADKERWSVSEAEYGKTAGQELAKREKDDDAFGAPKKKMVVTNADKKGNTPAYQNYKKGDKRYTAADHLKAEALYSAVYDKELKEKESYKTVAAVIDYDRSKKGTDDAVYDTEHGKKKQAKKERDYAAWERSKMKRDDPNWKHKKGSTSESKELAPLQSYVAAAKALLEGPGEPIETEGTKGKLKKELKDLKKGAETLKGKDIAAADKVAEDIDLKVNKEGFSSWRDDLREIMGPITDTEDEKKIVEKKVKNKVVIDPVLKLEQALDGEVISITESDECPDCGKQHEGECEE